MILNTLIEHQSRLEQAVVEIQMLPGIPQIHFLGLPDKVIKESFFRIKAAMKSSGFKFPVSQQVIVNIRPNALKKSSLGLELAVALGILHLTGQKVLPDSILANIIYGELDLDGGVREPIDLISYKNTNDVLILTGRSDHTTRFSRLNHLKEEIIFSQKQSKNRELIRPEKGLKSFYSEDEAELLFLMATSGLHTLLAGQAGAGKSFLAKNYISFYSPNYNPKDLSFSENWFPLISPHHSLTAGAFLGGTAQLVNGEIEKVENGVLVLDELLEFNSQILESLREPMTGESLRIARAGRVKEIKPLFQVVATTNFCICGKWIPQTGYYESCRFSALKCKGYLNRLSGPLVDRFGLIHFHKLNRQKRLISGENILKRIEDFKNKSQDVRIENDMTMIEKIYGELSGRRQKALLKVAEIYALESGASRIGLKHIKKSESWTIQGFLQLEKGMS